MLQDFLTEYGSRPWVWGEVDCCLVMADWLMAKGYPDCAAALRGIYRTEADLDALIEGAGGVLPLVQGCFASIGLEPSLVPAEGFVAVLGNAFNVHRQWGAIHDGTRWQVRLKSGFVTLTARPLAIWRT